MIVCPVGEKIKHPCPPVRDHVVMWPRLTLSFLTIATGLPTFETVCYVTLSPRTKEEEEAERKEEDEKLKAKEEKDRKCYPKPS